MKSLFPLIVFVLLSMMLLGCGPKVIDKEQLQFRKGIAYVVNSEEPFTGKVVSHYSNGQKKFDGDYVDGKNQRETTWYENGQKKREVDELLRKSITWYENGKKESESDPLQNIIWFESGQKHQESNFVNGWLHGKTIFWYENGQKKLEVDWVKGNTHGKTIGWYENGKKKYEEDTSTHVAQ